MWEYNYTDELCHYGVLGMKWGVRRYRKRDGTLTRAGRKRYGDDRHEDYKKAHDNKSVKLMSDQELRERNNRLQAERTYGALTKKTSVGKKVVNGIIATGATIGGLTAAYKAISKHTGPAWNKTIDKIGDHVMKDLNNGLAKPWDN